MDYKKNLTAENVMCMKLLLLNTMESGVEKISLLDLIHQNIDCSIGDLYNGSIDIKIKKTTFKSEFNQDNITNILSNVLSNYIRMNINIIYNIYDNSEKIIQERLDKNEIRLFLNPDICRTLFYAIILDDTIVKFSLA